MISDENRADMTGPPLRAQNGKAAAVFTVD